MDAIAILNPISGNKDPQLIKQEVINRLEDNSFKYEILETQEPKEAFKIAKKAVEKEIKLIIAIGGDGTINEVINAIACSNSCLGIIPNGTGNLLATSLGIPIDTTKALNIIFQGKKKRIDLGRINEQYFSIIAGCGFDAAIMKNVSRTNKKFFGLMAYFLEGIKQSLFPKRAVFKLVVDGKKLKKRALTVLVINSANILGNLIKIVPNASIDDGYLDVCIFSPRHTGEFIPVLWKILTQEDFVNNKKERKIIHYKAKKVSFQCRPNLPIQADGDVIGYPPVEIEAIPAAIEIMVPNKVSTFVMDPEEFFRSLIEESIGGISKM